MTTTPHCVSPNELAGLLKQLPSLPEEQGRVRVSGIFVDRGNKPYAGDMYYDDLRDPVSLHTLTLQLPGKLKKQLRDGRAYVLHGFINRSFPGRNLRLEFLFNVTEVEEIDLPSFTEAAIKRSDVFYDKCKRGFKRVDSVILDALLDNNLVRLGLIYGVNAIVDKDVINRLAGASDRYQIEWRETKLSSQAAIIEALQELDATGNKDVIGIVRGGGELDIFDDIELASAASHVRTPFITAIGHAVNRTLCDQIADKDFDTPTVLGHFLSDMVAKAGEIAWRTRELSLRERSVRERDASLSEKAAQVQQQVASERQAREADRQHQQGEVAELQRKYSKLQEAHRNLLEGGEVRRPFRVRSAVLASLFIGMVIGCVIGVFIMKRMNFPAVQPIPAPQEQVQPIASPAVTPSPNGNGRRRRS
ncbi:MAG: exodeoxyribonuclease large subunit [Acidobacteriota bacterium]|nr:exodeoxyribonuclease large subunit [Acidobacteriota bacterium]